MVSLCKVQVLLSLKNIVVLLTHSFTVMEAMYKKGWGKNY